MSGGHAKHLRRAVADEYYWKLTHPSISGLEDGSAHDKRTVPFAAALLHNYSGREKSVLVDAICLAKSLAQTLADAAPGLIKVALRPPVSVEAVATACASAALGELAEGDATRRAVGVLDGTVAIKAAAGELTPTRLADGLNRGLDGLGDKLADKTEQLVEAFNKKMDKMGK